MMRIASRIALMAMSPLFCMSSTLGELSAAYHRAFLLSLFSPDDDEASRQTWIVRQLLALLRSAKS